MIVGFTGIARSGKNTAAEFLAEDYRDHASKPAYQWSFAEKLKKSAAACFGVGRDPIRWCDHLKQEGNRIIVDTQDGTWEVTGREFLQRYGTEAHREIFGTDFWVDALMSEIRDSYNLGFTTEERLDLITDVRFDNEAIAVQDHGGLVVKIDRPEVESGDKHASELGVSEEYIDLTILNDKSLREFMDEVLSSVYFAIGNKLEVGG